jgi:hypothetical protein
MAIFLKEWILYFDMSLVNYRQKKGTIPVPKV